MKTVKRLFFFFIAGICILMACSKTDESNYSLSDLSGGNLMNKPAVCGNVFVVEPRGDGLDDTENLQKAFNNALAEPPGTSVVQLVEGNYSIGFIEVHEFYGSFKGAGKGKTVITALNGLNIDDLIDQSLNTVLIKFVGGDVFMSNMTVKTPPGLFCTGKEKFLNGLVSFCARTYKYKSVNDYIKAVVDNAELIGTWDNCRYGLKAEFDCREPTKVPGGWPLSHTEITVTNCVFKDFIRAGALIWHIKEGSINIGTKSNGNVFDHIKSNYTGAGGGALGIWFNVNVDISVVDNIFNIISGYHSFQLWAAIYSGYLEQVSTTKVTICNIEGNLFNIDGGWYGIYIGDRRRYQMPNQLPMLIQLKNNWFNMNNCESGIICLNTKGTIIRNNHFTGNGSTGAVRINSEYATLKNENGLMLGNNFSNFTNSPLSVFLGAGTSNWTIVGGNLGETLINQGTGNIITGMNVNTSDLPLGETIVDNLQEWGEN